MCQRKPECDKYKDAPDAAIEPLLDYAARAEPPAERGHRPSDKLREKRQEKQHYLGVQDIGEKALKKYASCSGRLSEADVGD
jgi:hypothetical protein